jgi:hypothetical protein
MEQKSMYWGLNEQPPGPKLAEKENHMSVLGIDEISYGADDLAPAASSSSTGA